MPPHYSPTGSDNASASQRCPPDTRTLVRGRQRKRALRESPLRFILLIISTNYNLYDKNDNGGSKPRHIILLKFCIQIFTCGFNNRIDNSPHNEIKCHKNYCENQKYFRFKWNPCICHIT